MFCPKFSTKETLEQTWRIYYITVDKSDGNRCNDKTLQKHVQHCYRWCQLWGQSNNTSATIKQQNTQNHKKTNRSWRWMQTRCAVLTLKSTNELITDSFIRSAFITATKMIISPHTIIMMLSLQHHLLPASTLYKVNFISFIYLPDLQLRLHYTYNHFNGIEIQWKINKKSLWVNSGFDSVLFARDNNDDLCERIKIDHEVALKCIYFYYFRPKQKSHKIS